MNPKLSYFGHDAHLWWLWGCGDGATTGNIIEHGVGSIMLWACFNLAEIRELDRVDGIYNVLAIRQETMLVASVQSD